MDRRTFLAASAIAAAAGAKPRPKPASEFEYVYWSWERWRQITRDTRPRITAAQTGKAELGSLVEHEGKRITNVADWERRRKSLRVILDVFFGNPPAAKSPLEVKIVEETPADGYIRTKLYYQSEPGERVPAYLLRPKNLKSKTPAILCPHQTTQAGMKEPAGLAGDPLQHTALHLVQRGYVTLTWDALCFGERHKFETGHYGEAIPFYRKHPGWSLMSKMIWDLGRGIDYLETLDYVDRDRIGCAGHSHGGFTTLVGMAFEDRIRAGVSSCGYDTFRIDGNTWRWSRATALLPKLGFYTGSPYLTMDFYRAVPDSEVIETPFDLHEMLAMIAPRPIFFSTSDDDWVFPNSGWSTRKSLARLDPLYRVYKAPDRLATHFFRGGHSFPPAAQAKGFEWLARWLKS